MVRKLEKDRRLFRALREKCGECWWCGVKEALQVHHIDLNHKNNDALNMVVLCGKCHGRLHSLLQKMGLQEKSYVIGPDKTRRDD